MPRFQFKLDPLIRARRIAEQQAQRTVADIERERRMLEDRLRRQQQRIVEGKAAMRDRLIGPLDTAGLRSEAAAAMRLTLEGQRIVIELAGVHTRLEAARSRLIARSRDRRAVELLREKRFAEWKRDLDKRETAALDEVAMRTRAAASG